MLRKSDRVLQPVNRKALRGLRFFDFYRSILLSRRSSALAAQIANVSVPDKIVFLTSKFWSLNRQSRK